jgi:murein DD-endopeptidase MepM/ murein hydrolase activator NlpD
VVIRDWKGRKSFLVAHLSRRVVRVGQRVARGQTLGYTGNSGLSTAPHVHAEQRHRPFGFRDNEKPGWE